MNYENTKLAFDSYINECKKRIKDTFFHKDYLLNFKALRNNLIESGKVYEEISIEDAIKFERLEMIDTKINHTMGVVEDVYHSVFVVKLDDVSNQQCSDYAAFAHAFQLAEEHNAEQRRNNEP